MVSPPARNPARARRIKATRRGSLAVRSRLEESVPPMTGNSRADAASGRIRRAAIARSPHPRTRLAHPPDWPRRRAALIISRLTSIPWQRRDRAV